MRKTKKMVDLLAEMLEAQAIDRKVEYSNLTQDLLKDFHEFAEKAQIEKFTSTTYANLQINGVKKLRDAGWEYKRRKQTKEEAGFRFFTGADGELKKQTSNRITIYQFNQTNKL
jgi:hypothetical protein